MTPADKLFRTLEILSDDYRVKKNLLPAGFDVSEFSSGSVPYFKQYGYKVPKYISEIYCRYNGIKSDKYISGGLYYYSITPYLVNLNFYQAYDDKNIYSKLFPNVKQPNVVLKCMNGKLYQLAEETLSGVNLVSVEESLDIVRGHRRVIVKPSVGTGGGTGVELWDCEKLTKEELKDRIIGKMPNFIMQDIVINHPEIKRLNPTSLNTCRIYTYRRVGNSECVPLGSAIRFGGEGSIRDNACSGGGFTRINPDGLLDDRIYTYNNFEHRSLRQEKDIEKLVIPHYPEMERMCLELHESLPYFDIIGWDVTVDDKDDIVFIEYNYSADSEFLQIFNGPMFGVYTDELMEHLNNPINKDVVGVKRSFVDGYAGYEYIFDMNKKESL